MLKDIARFLNNADAGPINIKHGYLKCLFNKLFGREMTSHGRTSEMTPKISHSHKFSIKKPLTPKNHTNLEHLFWGL